MRTLSISSDFGATRQGTAQQQDVPNSSGNTEFGNQIRDVINPPINHITPDVFGTGEGLQAVGKGLLNVATDIQQVEHNNLILMGQAESTQADAVAASIPDRIAQLDNQLTIDAAANNMTPAQYQAERQNRINTMFGDLSNQGFQTAAGENRLKLHAADFKAKDAIKFTTTTLPKFSVDYYNNAIKSANDAHVSSMSNSDYNTAASIAGTVVPDFNNSLDKQATFSPEERTLKTQSTIDAGYIGNVRNEMVDNPYGVITRLTDPKMYPGLSDQGRKQAVDLIATYINMDEAKQEKFRKDRQDAAQGNLLSSMFQGTDVRSTATDMLNRGLLTASEYKDVMTTQNNFLERGTVTENPDKVVNLELGLMKGTAGIGDITDAFNSHEITQATTTRLLSMEQEHRHGAKLSSDPMWKSNRSFVEDMYTPGSPISFDKNQKRIQATVLREYDYRTLVKGENYRAVADELVKRREQTQRVNHAQQTAIPYPTRDALITAHNNGEVADDKFIQWMDQLKEQGK